MTSQSLLTQIASHFKAKRWKLVTAESCTGGMVAGLVTEVVGSSEWFECGFVTYSNESKMRLLGVHPYTLEHYGAVSEQTVAQMVEGALMRSNADIALAISGIAGPGGGSPDKPVGVVCFAWGCKGKPCVCETHFFSGDRKAVREQAVTFALRGVMQFFD